jgi:hypothetical protein
MLGEVEIIITLSKMKEAAMHTIEKIHQHLQKLPDPLQEEVLNFVEYLLFKTEHEAKREEARDWSSLSLTHAMRGMEDEDTPSYTLEDLQERFS